MSLNPYYLKLRPHQSEAILHINKVLSYHYGAILRMDVGKGKTLIAHAVSSKYEKVLFVASTRLALKDIKEKLEHYNDHFSKHVNVDYDVICKSSLHKIKKKKMREYKLVVIDEFHAYKNWSTNFVKSMYMNIDNKHTDVLFMSATPVEKDFESLRYVILKTGAFGDMKTAEWKEEFCVKDDKLSKITSSVVYNGLKKEKIDELNTILKCVTIDPEIACDLEPINFNFIPIKGESVKAESIEEWTNRTMENTLSRMGESVQEIANNILDNNIKQATIICKYHKSADLVVEELNNYNIKALCAKTSKEATKCFKKLEKNDGILVTTIGLLQSSLDLNSCDHVYFMETGYKWSEIEQAYGRFRRMGKQNILSVTFVAYEDEHSFLKSLSRKKSTNAGMEAPKHSSIGPSSLSVLNHCPASYYLPKKDFKMAKGASNFGSDHHAAFEWYLKNTSAKVNPLFKDTISAIVPYCREIIKKKGVWGCEAPVAAKSIDDELFGTCDFFHYDQKTGELKIVDYKNGKIVVKVENNIQLMAYTVMCCETHNLKPSKITHVIFQGTKKKFLVYDKKNSLDLMRNRVINIIDDVRKAEHSIQDYVCIKGDCPAFCPFKGLSDEEKKEKIKPFIKKGGKMATSTKKANTKNNLTPKYIRVEGKGQVFYAEEKPQLVNFGVSFDCQPKDLIFEQNGLSAKDAELGKKRLIEELNKEKGSISYTESEQYGDQTVVFSSMFKNDLYPKKGNLTANELLAIGRDKGNISVTFNVCPAGEYTNFKVVSIREVGSVGAEAADGVDPKTENTDPLLGDEKAKINTFGI